MTMDDLLDIQVCVVNSTQDTFLKSVFPRFVANAILLVIDQDRRWLTRIDGYNSRVVSSSQDCTNPLDLLWLDPDRQLNWTSLTKNPDQFRFVTSAAHWQSMRGRIISTNPYLEVPIIRLEEAQRRSYQLLEENDAMLFDGLRAALQAFNPPGIRTYLEALDDVRAALPPSMPPHRLSMMNLTKPPLIPAITHVLTRLPQCHEYRPADHTSFESRLMHAYAARNLEDESIRQDFQTPFAEWDSSSTGIDPKAMLSMLRFVDRKSRRELLVLMAHRKGANNTDVVGADLIYHAAAYQSLVFVQYKRLTDSASIQPSKLDMEQLDQMLDLCNKHTCAHRDAQGFIAPEYMRAGLCPMYYKLLDAQPTIDEKSKRMQGTYLQACLLKQLLSVSGSQRKAAIHRRGIAHESFYQLLGSGQLGSGGAIYRKLCEDILVGVEQPYVYAQERPIIQPPVQQQIMPL